MTSALSIVAIVSKDESFKSIAAELLKDQFDLVNFPDIQTSVDYIYNSLPSLIVIQLAKDDRLSPSILKSLKTDPIFSHLPVLGVLEDGYVIPTWDYLLLDDFIMGVDMIAELSIRADLCVKRSDRMVDVSPLTKLPGNIAILKQVQKRLERGDKFALAYCDIDHFKPFNDRYGFGRGDEVIKMLGRLILNNVLEGQPLGSFVGHIGGDDFIYITETAVVTDIAHNIINYFKDIVPTFYDEEDHEAGFITSVDRGGSVQKFPLMSISIGIAHNLHRTFQHFGEMAEAAAEMKKFAKAHAGNYVFMDRRHAA